MSGQEMRARIAANTGFFAALDQSGGSSPKALADYGVPESAYATDDEMFDLMHAMRTRVVTDAAFTSEHVAGAILFEQTMDRQVDGLGSAEYLWQRKGIVPFLKIDKGLREAADDVQLLKPMPGLDEVLERAVSHGVFGTKERSVIADANPAGVRAIVDQQYEVAHQVLGHGLVPILEPEVSIEAPDKAGAERLLHDALAAGLDGLADGQQVMFKITIPTEPDLYADLMGDPRVLRIVALSGGYSRDEACGLLRRNHGLTASFSRALLQGLRADMTDEEFDAELRAAIAEIATASADKD